MEAGNFGQAGWPVNFQDLPVSASPLLDILIQVFNVSPLLAGFANADPQDSHCVISSALHAFLVCDPLSSTRTELHEHGAIHWSVGDSPVAIALKSMLFPWLPTPLSQPPSTTRELSLEGQGPRSPAPIMTGNLVQGESGQPQLL